MNENFLNCKKVCYCPPGCPCVKLHSFSIMYEKLLDRMKPKKILEWGPGKNTEIALNKGIEVNAIEHIEKYAIPFYGNPLYAYKIIPVEEDFYLRKDILHLYDLFFIDSRRRAECMESVSECDHDFIACLHDAQRYRYWYALKKFKYVVFLDDGFCAATNNNDYFEMLKEIAGI